MEILFVINIKMIFVFVHEYVCLKSVKQLKTRSNVYVVLSCMNLTSTRSLTTVLISK